MWFAITDNTRSLEGCVCFGFIMWHHFWQDQHDKGWWQLLLYTVYDKSIVHSGKYIIIFSNKYAAYIKGDLNVLSQNSFHIHHFIIAQVVPYKFFMYNLTICIENYLQLMEQKHINAKKSYVTTNRNHDGRNRKNNYVLKFFRILALNLKRRNWSIPVPLILIVFNTEYT